MKPTSRKYFAYLKRVDCSQPGGNLTERLVACWAKKLPIEQRVQPLEDDSKILLARLNLARNDCELVFFRYAPGDPQFVAKLESGKLEAQIEQIPASALESDDSADREFLRGVAYVRIRGNHALMVMATSLRDTRVEQHLNWLIEQALGALPVPEIYSLENVETWDTANDEPESIRFSSGLLRASDIELASGEGFLSRSALENMKAIFEKLGVSLKLDRLDHASAQSVRLKLELAVDRRTIPEDAEPNALLQAVAVATSQRAGTAVQYRSGVVRSRSELHVKFPVEVPINNGIIGINGIQSELKSVLDRLASEGKLG